MRCHWAILNGALGRDLSDLEYHVFDRTPRPSRSFCSAYTRVFRYFDLPAGRWLKILENHPIQHFLLEWSGVERSPSRLARHISLSFTFSQHGSSDVCYKVPNYSNGVFAVSNSPDRPTDLGSLFVVYYLRCRSSYSQGSYRRFYSP